MAMTAQERETVLVKEYGEVVNFTTAGRILSRSLKTVKAMLEDGRIDYACAGTSVDVRSIARYIMAPKKEDFEARVRKSGRKWTV